MIRFGTIAIGHPLCNPSLAVENDFTCLSIGPCRLDRLSHSPSLNCNSPSLFLSIQLYVLRISVVTFSCLQGSCRQVTTMWILQGSAKGDFWYATHIPARLGVEFEVGDIVGGCSSLVFLLTVPLLRSPQDVPPPSYRRPFRTRSMDDDSCQRYRLAEDRKRAILSHCGRERADTYASARL